jgi:hypothetical protein
MQDGTSHLLDGAMQGLEKRRAAFQFVSTGGIRRQFRQFDWSVVGDLPIGSSLTKLAFLPVRIHGCSFLHPDFIRLPFSGLFNNSTDVAFTRLFFSLSKGGFKL